jgi:XTP/dITP diphosphohydrolase
MDILIGTNNAFKIDEMEWFLRGIPDLTIHYLKELENVPDVEEDGETLEENAIKKAVVISKLTDWIVMTSDVGILIDALGEKWDYRRPRRILGEHATEKEKVEKLMELMKGLKGEERKAGYPLALAFAQDGKLLWSKEFISYEGYIVSEPDLEGIGQHKGMGRMWYLPQFRTTEDKLTPEQRNQLRDIQEPVRDEIREFFRMTQNDSDKQDIR